MQTIAEQILDFTYETSDSTIESVKMTVLDTISAIIMGTNEDEIQVLIDTIASYDTGQFSIIGDRRTFNLNDAAFLLGTTSVAVELDEGNQWSKGHPAVHVLPILLLHAQQHEAYTGKQLIDDFIRSYEACTYFGKITMLKPELHAHGTWGLLGTTTAVALANKADFHTFARALNLSASFATPTSWSAALEGAGIRNVYIGESIVGGLRAWQLANAQIEAPKENAQLVYGSILGAAFHSDMPFQQNFLAIENNYFKYHAFCRYAHVPLEAFQMLVEEESIEVNQIQEVKVSTYERAATLCNQKTHNSLSSKFSIPFALASWMYERNAEHQIFKDKLYLREDIKELTSKIKVMHDHELDSDYPNIMPAVVEVKLTDGRLLQKRLDYARGGPQQKSNFTLIKEKFINNTKDILSSESQQKLIEYIEYLECRSSLKEIFAIINSGIKGGCTI